MPSQANSSPSNKNRRGTDGRQLLANELEFGEPVIISNSDHELHAWGCECRWCRDYHSQVGSGCDCDECKRRDRLKEQVESDDYDPEKRIQWGLSANENFRQRYRMAKAGESRGGGSDAASVAVLGLANDLYYWSGSWEATERELDDLDPPTWAGRGQKQREKLRKKVEGSVKPHVFGQNSAGIAWEPLEEVLVAFMDSDQPSTQDIVNHPIVSVEREQTKKALDILRDKYQLVEYKRDEQDGRKKYWVLSRNAGSVDLTFEEDYNSRDLRAKYLQMFHSNGD